MGYLWTEQLNPELHYNTKQIKTPNQKKTQKPPPTHAPKNPLQNCTSLLSVKKKTSCFRSFGAGMDALEM